MKTFVTGHTGFIGTHLVRALHCAGHIVVLPDNRPDLHNIDELSKLFAGSDVVFHCAGFAHADDNGAPYFAEQHWTINYQGAINVAEAAIKAGVKRMVFISTSKAVADDSLQFINEEFTSPPVSAYGKAKRAAEEYILGLSQGAALEVVIVRPVMVYGRNGKANLPRIMNGIRQGWFPPLPQAGRRSLIHIDDLTNSLLLAAAHPFAAGKIYFLADSQHPASRELYDTMRKVLGLAPLKWSVPDWLLRVLAQCGDGLQQLTGRVMPFNRDVYDKLMQPALYSSEKISRELGWQAVVDLEAGIRTMIAD